jgi:hypothetical protein
VVTRYACTHLPGLRGEELGVGADVAGEADVGDDVGGDEEVDAVLVGVEGRVQRRVQRLLDDLAEVGGADVQQRPREAPHRLLDRPSIQFTRAGLVDGSLLINSLLTASACHTRDCSGAQRSKVIYLRCPTSW